MVCPSRGGKMEALARLLLAGKTQQTASEEAGCPKLAAQYIQRELREADEANLVDEEDMHVFGLRPLTDPLHLVCCNACKKPIKASQYVAHTELCKSLNAAEEIALEVNGSTAHKKRQRKERKKSLTANSRTSSHLNVATVSNNSGVSPGLTDCSEGAISHRKKHSKIRLVTGNRQLLSDGVTKSWSANSRETVPCEEPQERSTEGSDNTGSTAVAVNIPNQLQKLGSRAEDVPRPLATKMYYSQRQHRLRSALSYIYHCGDEFTCPKVLESNVMPMDILCTSNNSRIQIDYQQEKAHDHSFPLRQKPDLLQMVDSEGCPPPLNFASQFPVDNVLTHLHWHDGKHA